MKLSKKLYCRDSEMSVTIILIAENLAIKIIDEISNIEKFGLKALKHHLAEKESQMKS